MAKRLTSIRLSDLTDRQLSKLAAGLGMTASEVITVAVDRLYQKEMTKMSNELTVELSRQDLADFLDDNPDWMEQYQAELQRRLTGYGYEATVEISDVLSDKITADDVDQARQDVDAVMARMGNELDDWLKQ